MSRSTLASHIFNDGERGSQRLTAQILVMGKAVADYNHLSRISFVVSLVRVALAPTARTEQLHNVTYLEE